MNRELIFEKDISNIYILLKLNNFSNVAFNVLTRYK